MILPPDREKEITNLTSWGLKIVATINFVRLGKTIEFDGFPMFYVLFLCTLYFEKVPGIFWDPVSMKNEPSSVPHVIFLQAPEFSG